MRFKSPVLLALALTTLLVAGCPSGTDDDADGGADGGGDGGSGPLCEELVRPPCEDTMFLEMNLQSTIAPGQIVTLADGEGGFDSHVDATAGGFMANPPDAYVYAKFTPNGLQKVELSDEDATLSHDWDIAFHRFVIRINSGASGASCVTAAGLPTSVLYADVTEVPTGLTFVEDDFYDESCNFIDDGSGLGTSPLTALSGFYAYTSCVSMTGQIFIVQLRDGSHVKLEVESYYEPTKQEQCDTLQTAPTPPTGSGNIRMHWAFLP
ncbi:MAG: HmuY family protein [Deltaproteobacteria bacterium]|nr:HmuY family protein [Deltaproteobacteria bacterium]